MYSEVARVAFIALIDVFTRIFMLIHFNFKNRIKIKIDVFEFVIAIIFSQLINRDVNNREAM